MLTIQVFFGLGEAGAFPIATRSLARWMRPTERGFAQGITHAGSRLGAALTPPIVVLIIASFGWRAERRPGAAFVHGPARPSVLTAEEIHGAKVQQGSREVFLVRTRPSPSDRLLEARRNGVDVGFGEGEGS